MTQLIAYTKSVENLASAADITSAVLVPQGLSKSAFVFGPLFLGFHKLWLELIAYGAFMLLLVLPLAVFNPALAFFVSLLPPLFFLLEGNSMRHSFLERRGFTAFAYLDAGSADEAEWNLCALAQHLPDDEAVEVAAKLKPPTENTRHGIFGLEGW